MISINFRDPRPIYEQIKDGMRRLIVSGALPAGSKISSVREMATGLAINPSTIQRAYRELEAEGYIYVPSPEKEASSAQMTRPRLCAAPSFSGNSTSLLRSLATSALQSRCLRSA